MAKFDENKEIMVILDANAYVHSSFHGYTPKLDARGQDQRVLYGIMQALVDLTYQLPRIDALFVVFDPSDGSLFRKSVFPSYKANRPPSDPDLLRQRDEARAVLENHLGLACVAHPGYEADDTIGTLAYLAKDTYDVVIVSPDKDLAQLVQDNVFLLRRFRTKETKGYKLYNKDTVLEIFGVHPHQIPDWLALVGDVADNLPGLHKVGEKTACNILKKYPSIEHMLAVVHEMEDAKLKDKVMNAKDTLKLVKHLATIVCDLPVGERAELAMAKADEIRQHENYSKKLHKLYEHYSWPPHYLEMFL